MWGWLAKVFAPVVQAVQAVVKAVTTAISGFQGNSGQVGGGADSSAPGSPGAAPPSLDQMQAEDIALMRERQRRAAEQKRQAAINKKISNFENSETVQGSYVPYLHRPADADLWDTPELRTGGRLSIYRSQVYEGSLYSGFRDANGKPNQFVAQDVTGDEDKYSLYYLPRRNDDDYNFVPVSEREAKSLAIGYLAQANDGFIDPGWYRLDSNALYKLTGEALLRYGDPLLLNQYQQGVNALAFREPSERSTFIATLAQANDGFIDPRWERLSTDQLRGMVWLREKSAIRQGFAEFEKMVEERLPEALLYSVMLPGEGPIGSVGPGGSEVIYTLDLFGGHISQIPGAINVDIIAESGVQASVTELPFASESVGRIIANGPYPAHPKGSPIGELNLRWFSEAARVLKPGGELIVNAARINPFSQIPQAELEKMGLVIYRQGPLDPSFEELVFKRTNNTIIPNEDVITIVYKKVK